VKFAPAHRAGALVRNAFRLSPAGGVHSMKASATLVRCEDGPVIAANPSLSITAPAGAGLLGAALD